MRCRRRTARGALHHPRLSFSASLNRHPRPSHLGYTQREQQGQRARMRQGTYALEQHDSDVCEAYSKLHRAHLAPCSCLRAAISEASPSRQTVAIHPADWRLAAWVDKRGAWASARRKGRPRRIQRATFLPATSPSKLPELSIAPDYHLGRPTWTPTSFNYSRSCILPYHTITVSTPTLQQPLVLLCGAPNRMVSKRRWAYTRS